MNEKHIVFVLCMAALNLFTAKHAHEVYLHPQNPVKHINESVELICTVAGCSQEIKFMWSTLLDSSTGGQSKTNQTVSRLLFKTLSIEHEKIIVCKVICGGYKENKTKIRVYSFPTNPVISRIHELQLQCAIHNVYPPSKFKIQWFRGDTQISDEYDTSSSEVVAQGMHSIYKPTDEDRGKNITCKVTLNMEGVPEDRTVRSVTVQYGPAFITISNHTTVRLGERLELRCDTDRESSIMWTKLGKSGAVALGKDKELVFEHADWNHTGEYECEVSTAMGSWRSKVNVTVQDRRSVVPHLQNAIIPAVSCMTLLGAAAALILFLRNMKKNSQDIAIDALNT
ncbi:vascular cell adhesion protein 1 isoform X1 [Electrophorus electricus]|uniref:vascular cell adhesion protein 1 isoform X1 n=1 Tax=Electrophorus electricus TaxID=8005 RepID=UPI0015CFECDD|nr:vascular cell adhesion protein 1 isoform X1 [Electrophorus electricus]